MATAHFRFYEELNDFLPKERRKRDIDTPFDRRASVKDMVEALGVPHTEVDLILVNGQSVDFTRIIEDGDRISVYPDFESFDLHPVCHLRPEPLRQTTFVLDVHLGKLARRLRLLGFDCHYQNNLDDPELAAISVQEHRILLTRDRGLLMRKIVTHGMFIRSGKVEEQVLEVMKRFDLIRSVRPFTRCLKCNGRMEAVEKSLIEDRLKPLTRRYYHEFYRCTTCDRLYWKGSHYERLKGMVEKLEPS